MEIKEFLVGLIGFTTGLTWLEIGMMLRTTLDSKVER